MTNYREDAVPLRSVILVAHSQFRGLLNGMARKLRDDHGCAIHLHCATPEEETFYRRVGGDLFASITVNNVLYRSCRQSVGDEAAVTETARANEAWLGTTINEIAVSDRHLGRGYALGGLYHPRSRISEDTSYPQMLNGYNRLIAFWKDQIRSKKADLVINGDKVAALVCRAENVPYRTLAPSRYKNYFQWAVSEFFDNPRIEAAYRRIQSADRPDLKVPYDIHMELRRVFLKQTRFRGLVFKMAHLLLRHTYWRLRGYEKAKVYLVGSEIRYLWRQWRDRGQLTGKRTKSLSAMRGQPFVYYPLHTEPETALQMLSPEYFQLSCIASLSRDLPAGVRLVVKDIYYAVGRRPADFYRQIREFKNVDLIDMLELGPEVVQACSAVATITGTGGLEGAVQGKPVITFGRHNQYNFLPHVSVVEDETHLKTYLANAVDPSFDQEKAADDGARYLRAVVECSFDLAGFQVSKPDDADDRVIDAAYRSLLDSLAMADTADLVLAQ